MLTKTKFHLLTLISVIPFFSFAKSFFSLNDCIEKQYLLLSNNTNPVIRVYEIETNVYECLNYKGDLRDENNQFQNKIVNCNRELFPNFYGKQAIFYALNEILDNGFFLYYSDNVLGQNEYFGYSVYNISTECKNVSGTFYPNEFNFQEC